MDDEKFDGDVTELTNLIGEWMAERDHPREYGMDLLWSASINLGLMAMLSRRVADFENMSDELMADLISDLHPLQIYDEVLKPWMEAFARETNIPTEDGSSPPRRGLRPDDYSM